MPAPPPPLILHVLHALHIGGMENGLVNLVNHLPADRFRHAIVCVEDFSPAFRARITRPDIEVIALNRSRIGVWALRRALYTLCRTRRPALVHTRNLSGLDAVLPARLAGVPCVHSEHGWDVDNLDGRAWKPLLLRRLHRPLINEYIAVSRDLARFLEQIVGVPESRVHCLHNGVDANRFHPSPHPTRNCLPEAFRDPARVLFGTVGRLQDVKDQATLIRAFAALPQLGHASPPGLVLVGEGPLEARLKALADALGVGEHTAFLGPSDAIPEVMRALDVFVLPSLNEGISNTLLEAMASGLPVLATHVGGNRELFEDGVEGQFFAPRDVPALTHAFVSLLGDPRARARMGAASRARVERHFSLPRMMEGYAGVYDAVITARA